MSQLGLNDCYAFDVDGEVYYFLSCVSEDGIPMLTGLPIIYTMQNGKPIQLSEDDAFSIISKLPDDDGEE